MKKSIIFFAITVCLLLSVSNAHAKIRRVGYFGTPVANTDYTTLQAAIDAANAGDTILMYPGGYSANLNKRLVVIGYGYNLTGTGADTGYQVITGGFNATILFYPGSDSSVIEGLDNLNVSLRGDITEVTINSCVCNVGGVGAPTFINWKFLRCYLAIHYDYVPTYRNVLFSNNVITYCIFPNSAAACSGIFNNNIFTINPDLKNGAYSLYNNVFLSTSVPANAANCIFDYNIASNNIIPNNAPHNHNKPNTDLTKVFVGYPTQGTYSNDGRYALATGSPAIGAGENGIDCGIFGGSTPYHLAGIPPIPSFYKLTAPSNITSGNPYTITFSVRSNN